MKIMRNIFYFGALLFALPIYADSLTQLMDGMKGPVDYSKDLNNYSAEVCLGFSGGHGLPNSDTPDCLKATKKIKEENSQAFGKDAGLRDMKIASLKMTLAACTSAKSKLSEISCFKNADFLLSRSPTGSLRPGLQSFESSSFSSCQREPNIEHCYEANFNKTLNESKAPMSLEEQRLFEFTRRICSNVREFYFAVNSAGGHWTQQAIAQEVKQKHDELYDNSINGIISPDGCEVSGFKKIRDDFSKGMTTDEDHMRALASEVAAQTCYKSIRPDLFNGTYSMQCFKEADMILGSISLKNVEGCSPDKPTPACYYTARDNDYMRVGLKELMNPQNKSHP